MRANIRVLKTGRRTFENNQPINTTQIDDTFICPECNHHVPITYWKLPVY